ncbi:nucleotidyltransferase domain-containing protein [Rhizobium sp. N113]|uniref:SMODS domain-containing nucleotidyltransferase n=1 Tax=Rhizobium TaxID=379 RepID=UPI0007E9802F|nr:MULTISPECIES: nucleotidyltransferase [Rhizobium]ANL02194.1 nucleotidyltransferase domain-containing protein [Rhizobium esperanzae]ANL08322.1 nucleotidyltransferase domain-containing protein [Rhizobium sp. N1341]ANL20371.1 nucleotidyltransferase domain-containing protein [Rhizobium sp. N113]ANM33045.1 nucleotidyltransferase domain-containing protein [Rhizobium sp. N871]ANM39163.1 nucleotidyltransferase domain-containing protein [Rhizobium sp. N741]
MKLVALFDDFLKEVVNINATRLGLLTDGVYALKKFIRRSGYAPRIRTFYKQGSWAHQTIIRPVGGGEYDADLLVFVDPVKGWTAKDYVEKLYNEFSASGTYSDKVKIWEYCVTIEYAGDRKIDIAPCVVDRLWPGQGHEVCNRADDQFHESRPIEYTSWLIEKNGYSGGNSFRKVTRLLKYLRDYKKTFTCKSVLLTTMIGEQIEWMDQGKTNYADVPTALLTLISRLDEWLQANATKPQVRNPKLSSEDFSTMWSEEQYQNFRSCIHRYREWIEQAYHAENRDESIKLWQKVFGDDFGRSANVLAQKADTGSVTLADTLLPATGAHHDSLVEIIKRTGLSILPKWFFSPPYLKHPEWRTEGEIIRSILVIAEWRPGRESSETAPVRAGDALPPRGGLWFDVRQADGSPIPDGYRVEWRVANTGAVAIAKNAQRGGFYVSHRQNKRWEDLQYRGVHMVEAFVVRMRDDILVAQSDPFGVVIE